MKLFVRSLAALALAQAFSFAAAVASDKVIEKPVAADTPEKFVEVAADIRKEMSPGGRYEFIRPDDKSKAETDLDTMASMLQKAGSVSAMRPNEQVQLFNVQEHLNGILTHSDRNRLVCERRAPVGTNIPVNTCKTFGELERERRDSQKMLRDAGKLPTQTICGRPDCPRGGG